MSISKLTSCLLLLSSVSVGNVFAENIVDVEPCSGDATAALQEAIEKARAFGGKPTTIRLSPGDYNISRDHSSRHLYHISNTASISENPDQTKHIGLWFRKMDNVTLDGNGARLVTHGEMTSLLLDSCTNMTLKNFSLTAADPSVPEIRITDVGDRYMVFEVTEPSDFEVAAGHFHFKGEGWVCADGGRLTSLPELAQVYYPWRDVTLRCDSPFDGYTDASLVGDRKVRMSFDKKPGVHVGEIYQIRHGIRNEVCAFIAGCKDVRLENVEFNFLGNFGLVGQYSENLTYENIRCRPDTASGRTDAGFADFVQMSGCKGKIRIADSYFAGAHDDPINIHGTHLRAVESTAPDRLRVRFMHHQTYGFQPFFEGDSIEIVDIHSLLGVEAAVVREVKQIDDYDFELVFDRELPLLSGGASVGDFAVENITWTPEVEIVGNYFARTPTRGILITTRGKSLIEGNTFFRIPMPSILVADDARSWYESGPVRDLTIRRNTFIECASPVIDILPENDRYDGPVHRNITIESNSFILDAAPAINIKATENVTIKGNIFEPSAPLESLIKTDDVSSLRF